MTLKFGDCLHSIDQIWSVLCNVDSRKVCTGSSSIPRPPSLSFKFSWKTLRNRWWPMLHCIIFSLSIAAAAICAHLISWLLTLPLDTFRLSKHECYTSIHQQRILFPRIQLAYFLLFQETYLILVTQDMLPTFFRDPSNRVSPNYFPKTFLNVRDKHRCNHFFLVAPIAKLSSRCVSFLDRPPLTLESIVFSFFQRWIASIVDLALFMIL